MPANSLDYRIPPHDPALLYAALYAGEIVRYSGLPEMAAVITSTRTFVEERLAHSPVEIHRHFEHEELALRLAAIQRDYARSSEVKKLWQALFEAARTRPGRHRARSAGAALSSPQRCRHNVAMGAQHGDRWFHRDT